MKINLEHIKHLINTLPFDLRMEVVLASLFSENEYINNLIVSPKGQFRRPFRKDILNASIVDFKLDTQELLNVDISRDGLYDILPEAIFHYPNTDNKNNSLELMTGEYRRQQKEEKDAREFFAPFENELYYVKLNRERKELEYLLSINGIEPFDFFYDLWGIDRSIPKFLASKLFRILPLTFTIVGNIESTERCLSYLIDEPVKIVVEQENTDVVSDCPNELGGARLGMDTVVGDSFKEHNITYNFELGPFKNSSLSDYIYQGKREKFLEIFFAHFLPLEVDYNVRFLLPKEEEEFNLKTDQIPILGLTTTI